MSGGAVRAAVPCGAGPALEVDYSALEAAEGEAAEGGSTANHHIHNCPPGTPTHMRQSGQRAVEEGNHILHTSRRGLTLTRPPGGGME